MFQNNNPIYLKIPIIGNSNVGKSTLFTYFRRQTKKHFTYKANDFILLENVQYDGKIFNIQFWDTMGVKTVDRIQREIFPGSSLAIVVYDVSEMSKKSYRVIPDWVDRLWRENDGQRIPFLIIGNKIDLRKANRPTLSLRECSDLSDRYTGFLGIKIPQLEISALAKENTDQVLGLLLELFLRHAEHEIRHQIQ